MKEGADCDIPLPPFLGAGPKVFQIPEGWTKEFHWVFKPWKTRALRIFSTLWVISLIILFSGLTVPRAVMYIQEGFPPPQVIYLIKIHSVGSFNLGMDSFNKTKIKSVRSKVRNGCLRWRKTPWFLKFPSFGWRALQCREDSLTFPASRPPCSHCSQHQRC